MNFFALSGLVNGLIALVFGYFVIRKDYKNITNVTCGLLSLATAIWSFFYWAWLSVDSSRTLALLFIRLLSIGSTWVPIFYFHWVLTLLNYHRKRRYVLIGLYTVGVFFSLFSFSNLYIAGVEPKMFFPFWPNPGIFYSFYLFAIYFGIMIVSLYLLIAGAIQSQGEKRKQLLYVIGGTIIGFGGGLTNFFLWYNIPFPPYGNFLVGLYPIIFTHAITEHSFMGIKVAAAKVFSVILIGMSLIELILSKSIEEGVFRFFIFIVVSFFASALLKSVMAEIRRREQMEVLNEKLKKVSNELKAANKELQRLDQAKSEFLSIASHQLRTPLTAIKGFVSMMLEGSFGKVPKLINTNLGKVFDSTERLISLVESLLNISRIEAGRIEFEMEPVDLVGTTQNLVNEFQQKAKKKKLKLEFHPEPKLPKVSADPQKVKEIISNLIDNSVKYTPKGEIIVGLHLEGQSVVFTCQDTGVGIIPEDLPRLFEKFVRGKGMQQVNTEGTGLGLYFARMVVENMGGRIWAESPGKDQGAKFSFSLPLADKSQAKKVK